MRSIPDPGFAGDIGAPDRRLAAALARYDAGELAEGDVVSALLAARLLVPVVAVAGGSEARSARTPSTETVAAAGPAQVSPGSTTGGTDMAAVLLTGADGRLALLSFTGTEALAAWNPQARPVPVTARVAARSALQEDAAALVIDVAGPTRFVVEGDDLVGLASGMRLGRVGDRTAWIGTPWIGTPGESSDSLSC